MEVVAAVLSGFVLAAVAPWLHRRLRGATGWTVAVLPIALTVLFAQYVPVLARGELLPPIQFAWAPSLGVSFSFYLDGLSILFALLISSTGALILIYTGGYLAGHHNLGRLYAFLLMFMASMLGLVLADNVITLFVFWELTSVSSYLLIGFDHNRAEARAAALQALLVTSAGGLALLAGLVLLGQVAGSMEMSAMFGEGEAVRSSPQYVAIAVLVLLGAFTKSAQFPFHFWLPGAMEAPTPVSAYLHSATMVKAGVYLVARLTPVLGDTAFWQYSVSGIGAVTMLVAAVLALRESDLKRILAYSTVSALGALMFQLGIATPLAVLGAAIYLPSHAMYKGALFLVTGAVDHETGTRNVLKLRGLWRAMPITAIAAGLGAVSMAGLPPLVGFVSKEVFYEATLHGPGAALITTAAVAGNALMVTVALLVALRPFAGRRVEAPKHPHEAPWVLWLAPLVLGVGGVISGVLPGQVGTLLVLPAAGAILGPTAAEEFSPLKLWHGWNLALALSVVTLAMGIAVYAQLFRIRPALISLDRWSRWSPQAGYEALVAGVNTVGRLQTQWLQNGFLRYYLLTTLVVTEVLVGFGLYASRETTWSIGWSEAHFYEIGLVALIITAAGAAAVSKSRFGAIAALGVVGYGLALVYVIFGAPDLAMTQFLIETLTVILFVLAFYHLPGFVPSAQPAANARDLLVALIAGSIMTALTLMAGIVQFYPKISTEYVARSLPEAHGRNVVNVILVDFRGLDTLGEIVVLSLAGIGVFALLKLRLDKRANP